MSRYRQALGVAVMLAVGGALSAPVRERPAMDADEARLIERHALRIPVSGCITGSFDKAYSVLMSSNLLDKVQQAYAAQLPPGKRPEFEVRSAGQGLYYYVNKDDERCDIRELWRTTDTNTTVRCAFHVAGERTFGRFESLIYMTVSRSAEESGEVLNYEADVRVWPRGAIVRMVLRYMPGVELYFRKKTAEMRGIISTVFTRLAGPGSA